MHGDEFRIGLAKSPEIPLPGIIPNAFTSYIKEPNTINMLRFIMF